MVGRAVPRTGARDRGRRHRRALLPGGDTFSILLMAPGPSLCLLGIWLAQASAPRRLAAGGLDGERRGGDWRGLDELGARRGGPPSAGALALRGCGR
jgi:hypothetical protein